MPQCDADGAFPLSGELRSARSGHRHTGDRPRRGHHAAALPPFRPARSCHRRPRHIDHTVRRQSGLRQRLSVQVRPRDAPKHFTHAPRCGFGCEVRHRLRYRRRDQLVFPIVQSALPIRFLASLSSKRNINGRISRFYCGDVVAKLGLNPIADLVGDAKAAPAGHKLATAMG